MVARQQGFSLIELGVTLAVMVVLMGAAAPLTMSWVKSSRIADAKAKLQQAYGLSKALAQRNAVGARAPAPAAGMKLDGDTLLVCSGDPSVSSACAVSGASNVVWRAKFPVDTTATIGSGQKLGFDNTGLPLSSIDFNINSGGQSEADKFI
jgi:prepilin-type N-terminal cleavage/methylation domain-containing protein